MQKSVILFIVLIIVIAIAVLTENRVEHEKTNALIALGGTSNH